MERDHNWERIKGFSRRQFWVGALATVFIFQFKALTTRSGISGGRRGQGLAGSDLNIRIVPVKAFRNYAVRYLNKTLMIVQFHGML